MLVTKVYLTQLYVSDTAMYMWATTVYQQLYAGDIFEMPVPEALMIDRGPSIFAYDAHY